MMLYEFILTPLQEAGQKLEDAASTSRLRQRARDAQTNRLELCLHFLFDLCVSG